MRASSASCSADFGSVSDVVSAAVSGASAEISVSDAVSVQTEVSLGVSSDIAVCNDVFSVKAEVSETFCPEFFAEQPHSRAERRRTTVKCLFLSIMQISPYNKFGMWNYYIVVNVMVYAKFL